jgi:hypothetical protein
MTSRIGARSVFLLVALLGLLRSAAGESPRVAPWGDPLPEGAVARLGTLRYRHALGVQAVALAADGKLLASSAADGSIRLWDPRTGNAVHLLQHAGSADTTVLAWDLTRLRGSQAPARPGAEELTRWCDDLASADAGRAYRAVRGLAPAPATVPLLRKTFASAAEPPARRIPKLLAQLEDDDFDVREKAMRELTLCGREAEEALRQAVKSGSAQVKRAAGEVLAQLRPGLSQRQLRDFRALEVLERLGTPEARKCLAELAGGPADAWLTRQARLPLRRLEGR